MLEYIDEICGDKFKSKTDVNNYFLKLIKHLRYASVLNCDKCECKCQDINLKLKLSNNDLLLNVTNAIIHD